MTKDYRDDEPRCACITLAMEAQGKEITTLEELMKWEELDSRSARVQG